MKRGRNRDILRLADRTVSEATSVDLTAAVQDGSFDLLRDFSELCRAEFDHLRAQQL